MDDCTSVFMIRLLIIKQVTNIANTAKHQVSAATHGRAARWHCLQVWQQGAQLGVCLSALNFRKLSSKVSHRFSYLVSRSSSLLSFLCQHLLWSLLLCHYFHSGCQTRIHWPLAQLLFLHDTGTTSTALCPRPENLLSPEVQKASPSALRAHSVSFFFWKKKSVK